MAIELAAARIKLLPPPALLARLGQRLMVLTSGVQDAPVRHQTLRKTIDWSYQLLDADEQRLFRWFSVFVGGCTLEAIEAIIAALDTQMPAASALDREASHRQEFAAADQARSSRAARRDAGDHP